MAGPVPPIILNVFKCAGEVPLRSGIHPKRHLEMHSIHFRRDKNALVRMCAKTLTMSLSHAWTKFYTILTPSFYFSHFRTIILN